jgi:hypothetical protein
MVIGWAMAERMRASLCTAALQMARNRGRFAKHSMVFHSAAPNTPPMHSRNGAALTVRHCGRGALMVGGVVGGWLRAGPVG